MPTKQRINVRYSRYYDIKMISNNGALGIIDEVVWHKATTDAKEEGFDTVAVSFKIKELNIKSKVTPEDTFQINVTGKIGGPYTGASEVISNVKLTTEVTSDKEENVNGFEEGKLYPCTGYMMIANHEDETISKKIAASIGGHRR